MGVCTGDSSSRIRLVELGTIRTSVSVVYSSSSEGGRKQKEQGALERSGTTKPLYV